MPFCSAQLQLSDLSKPKLMPRFEKPTCIYSCSSVPPNFSQSSTCWFPIHLGVSGGEYTLLFMYGEMLGVFCLHCWSLLLLCRSFIAVFAGLGVFTCVVLMGVSVSHNCGKKCKDLSFRVYRFFVFFVNLYIRAHWKLHVKLSLVSLTAILHLKDVF